MRISTARRKLVALALIVPGMLMVLPAAYGQPRGQPQVIIVVPRNPQPQLPPGAIAPKSKPPGPVVPLPVQNFRAAPARANAPDQTASAGFVILILVIVVAGIALVAGGVVLTLWLCHRPSTRSFDLKKFERLASAELDDFLGRCNFVQESADRLRDQCDITYGRGKYFLWIAMNARPRKGPPRFNVYLGEGDRDLTVSNPKVANLLQIKKLDEPETSTRGYFVEDGMRLSLQQARDDLTTFAKDFLAGRGAEFREQRALLTEAPAPRNVSPDPVRKQDAPEGMFAGSPPVVYAAQTEDSDEAYEVGAPSETSRRADARRLEKTALRRERERKRGQRRPQATVTGFSLIDAIPMDYSLQSNIGVLLGLLVGVLCAVIRGASGSQGLVVGLAPLSVLFWVWGCAAYAKGKGHSELMGLLGIIGCLGLLVLALLPDNSRGR